MKQKTTVEITLKNTKEIDTKLGTSGIYFFYTNTTPQSHENEALLKKIIAYKKQHKNGNTIHILTASMRISLSELTPIVLQEKYLIGQNHAVAKELEILEAKCNQNDYIVIDTLERYLPNIIGEQQEALKLRTQTLMMKLRSMVANKNLTIFIIGNSKEEKSLLISQNDTLVTTILINTREKEQNENETLIALSLNNKSDPFADISLKKEAQRSILEDMQLEDITPLVFPMVKTNIPRVDKKLTKQNIGFGDILPFNLHLPDEQMSKHLTQSTLKAIIATTDFNIKVLYLSPFETLNQFKARLNIIKKSIPIDKKALKRTYFKGVEELALKKEAELFHRDKDLDMFLYENITKTRETLGNEEPFFVIIDLYDIEHYQTAFDYNALRVVARGANCAVILGLSRLEKRFDYTNAINHNQTPMPIHLKQNNPALTNK